MGEITAPEKDDTRADAEETIEAVPDDEQEDTRKPTNDEESKNEDEIDAFFG